MQELPSPRHSESPANPPMPSSSDMSPAPGLAPRWIDNRWVILGMLFGVTLFLGWPALWLSRGFSGTEKVVITLLNLFWTIGVFTAFIAVMWWCWQQIAPVLQ